jgi:hypothetical protein
MVFPEVFRNRGMLTPAAKPIPDIKIYRLPVFVYSVTIFSFLKILLIRFFRSVIANCNPPSGHNFLHQRPGKKMWIINRNTNADKNRKMTMSDLVVINVKNPLKIASGSKITNSGNPTIDAEREITAAHLPMSGSRLYAGGAFLFKLDIKSML